MVAGGLGEKAWTIGHSTHLLIACPEIEPPDARVTDRSCAHGAGFQGHVQVGTAQPLLTQQLCALSDNQHLSMGGRVIVLPRAVAISCDDLAISHKHGADWHLIARSGKTGLFQCAIHEGGGLCHNQGLP